MRELSIPSACARKERSPPVSGCLLSSARSSSRRMRASRRERSSTGFRNAGRWTSRTLSYSGVGSTGRPARTCPSERSSGRPHFGAPRPCLFRYLPSAPSRAASASNSYSTRTARGVVPNAVASIGASRGKLRGCANAIASLIVVFPEPFAPRISEKRPLSSQTIGEFAEARYPSTSRRFRYMLGRLSSSRSRSWGRT